MIRPKQLVSIYVYLLVTPVSATYRTEGYAHRKLQRGLSAIKTWCERWNINKINFDFDIELSV
jgi:hypothetical protein